MSLACVAEEAIACCVISQQKVRHKLDKEVFGGGGVRGRVERGGKYEGGAWPYY